MKHFFSAEAVSDLQRLYDFIAENNPIAARHTARELLEGTRALRRFPRMGKRVVITPGQSAPDEIRDWFSGDYVVRYLILDDRIVILRVWHGKESRE